MQEKRPEIIFFTIASYLLSVAQLPALLWNPASKSWWFSIHSLLVAYMMAASIFLVVAILKTQKTYYFDKNSMLIAPMVALTLATMFFAGFSVSCPQNATKVRDSEESQTKNSFEEIPNLTDANSADWKTHDTHSEELSLNRSHQVASPAIPQTLNNKDSEKTLADRKNVDSGKTEEDYEAATVNWLVQASLAPSALDDHLGENWMASRLHHSVNTDMYHHHEAHTRTRSKTGSGLSRSNTTGQLLVNKSRKARALTSASSLSSREAFYPTLGIRSGLVSKLHERSRSIDADMALNVKPSVAWAHLATNSQSTNITNVTNINSHFSDQLTMRNSQSTLPKISLSESLTQTNLYNQHELSPSFKSSNPQTPEDLRFFSAPPAPSSKTHGHSAGSSMGDIIEGLEEIPGGIAKWTTTSGSNSMKNISLQEWERKKHSWLACEHEVKPIVYYLNSQNINESPGGFQSSKDITTYEEQNDQSKGMDGILMRSFSAPSLHTYRPSSDNPSAPASMTLAAEPGPLANQLEYTLYRTQTPPALTLVTEIPSVHSSPIKKILNFIKRDLILDAGGLNSSDNSVFNGHKHTDSVTTSMISAASGMSSRSGLPRKAIKNLFSRPSQADIPGTRTSFAFAMTPRMSPQKDLLLLVYSKPKKPLTFRYQDWEADTLDGLDRSRVSSVPSAVIGEYDREKWRTLKELQHPTQA